MKGRRLSALGTSAAMALALSGCGAGSDSAAPIRTGSYSVDAVKAAFFSQGIEFHELRISPIGRGQVVLFSETPAYSVTADVFFARRQAVATFNGFKPSWARRHWLSRLVGNVVVTVEPLPPATVETIPVPVARALSNLVGSR